MGNTESRLFKTHLQVIAATVISDPEKYNEAFLGKPNEEYSQWILDPEKWGGKDAKIICCFSNIWP